MATIRKRGKKYQARVQIVGTKPQAQTFERLQDARDWVARVEGDIRQGKAVAPSKARRKTVEDAVTRYKRDVLDRKNLSPRHYPNAALNFWTSSIGNYTLANVTPDVLSEQRQRLLDGLDTDPPSPRKPSTVNRMMGVLSIILSTACREWGWIYSNPCSRLRKLEEPQGRDRYLDADELQRLLDACKASPNDMLHDAVVVSILTGLRQSELLNLRWPDVSFDRGTITVKRTKNKRIKVIPLVGPALDCLKVRSRIRRIDSDLIFPGPKPRGESVQGYDVKNSFMAAVKAAKIDNLRWHDLRHTCGSYLAMSGASEREIMEVLGHVVPAMAKRYSHLSERHTKGVAERMAAAMFSGVKGADHA